MKSEKNVDCPSLISLMVSVDVKHHVYLLMWTVLSAILLNVKLPSQCMVRDCYRNKARKGKSMEKQFFKNK